MSASTWIGVATSAALVVACSAGPTDTNDVPTRDPGAAAAGSDGGAAAEGANAEDPSSAPANGLEGAGGSGQSAETAARFATRVVSFTPGACAGFGRAQMPAIVLGPPVGAGEVKGSLDVVSLGTGGEIVLSFEPAVLVDGPGIDLVVFENAFYPAGNRDKPYAEPGEVSVSEDGERWLTFPCASGESPYEGCAGWSPVMSAPTNDISPVDLKRAGGDAFDLATVGASRVRFVRIKDKTAQRCTSQGPNNNGFDLDALAALHVE